MIIDILLTLIFLVIAYVAYTVTNIYHDITVIHSDFIRVDAKLKELDNNVLSLYKIVLKTNLESSDDGK